MYNSIKKYYDMGLYSKDLNSDRWVGVFVQANWITKGQYEEITGEAYPAE